MKNEEESGHRTKRHYLYDLELQERREEIRDYLRNLREDSLEQ